MNKNKLLLGVLLTFLAFAICVSTVKAVNVSVDGDDVTKTTITFDVDSGSLLIHAEGIDTTHWHEDEIGNINDFLGKGSFTGTYSVTQNAYGGLQGYINTESKSGADFDLSVYSDLDVLSANHIKGIEGYFSAWASGEDAEMNMKLIGWGPSPGGWQEATNPYSEPCLLGSNIGKELGMTVDEELEACIGIRVDLADSATMYNDLTAWGWGISESNGGTVTTSYDGRTRTITATGSGSFTQYGFGKDYLRFDGKELLNGGGLTLSGSFDDGLSGTYDMAAN